MRKEVHPVWLCFERLQDRGQAGGCNPLAKTLKSTAEKQAHVEWSSDDIKDAKALLQIMWHIDPTDPLAPKGIGKLKNHQMITPHEFLHLYVTQAGKSVGRIKAAIMEAQEH